MSSVAKSTTVIAGEASESDDDTVATPTCVSYTEGRVPDFQVDWTILFPKIIRLFSRSGRSESVVACFIH